MMTTKINRTFEIVGRVAFTGNIGALWYGVVTSH